MQMIGLQDWPGFMTAGMEYLNINLIIIFYFNYSQTLGIILV